MSAEVEGGEAIPRALIYNVVKTSYHDDFRDFLYHFDIGVIQPDVQPSFFIKVECPALPALTGLHVPASDGTTFEFMNFDWALAEQCGSASRATAYIKVDVPLQAGEQRRLVFVDAEERHHNIAYMEYAEGRFSVTPVNPMLCRVTNLLETAPQKMTTIFVGGAPKSGTTWVEMLLNAHPDCVLTGENAFWDWPFNSYNIAELPVAPEERFIRRVSVVERPFSNAVAMMGYGRAEITFRQLAALCDATHIGDKSPGNALHSLQILQLFGNGHYVHCYRHPLDVVVSRAYHEILIVRDAPDAEMSMAVYSILPRDIIDDILDPNHDMEDLVRRTLASEDFVGAVLDGWLASNHYAGAAKREYPDRVHFVSYESLSQNSERAVQFLFRVMGLKSDDAVVNAVIDRCDFAKLSGGRSRGTVDSNSFFRNGLSGDFHGRFSAEMLAWAEQYLTKRGSYFMEEYFPRDLERLAARDEKPVSAIKRSKTSAAVG